MRIFAAISGLAFAVAVWLLAFNNSPYLDDVYLIEMQRQDGFWAPTASFQAMWGYYRYFYTSLMSPIYWLFAEHLWLARVAGLSLHAGSALLLLNIGRNLHWSSEASLLSFGLFLFFPFCLEAVAWPANLTQYPLAPFVALLGGALVVAPGARLLPTVIGAALMGFSLWIHEQVGPVALLLLCMIVPSIRKWRGLVVAIVLGLIFADLALIYLTRASNIRLSGSGAGSLTNAWKHVGYFADLIRTTPFGDAFYAQRGLLDRALMLPAAIIVAAFGWLLLQRNMSEPKVAAPLSRDVVLWVFAVGAYIVSLVPILMSAVPWHSARVVYIPFLAFCISGAYFVQIVVRSHLGMRLAQVLVILCLLCTPLALAAEADAFNTQVNANRQTVQSLERKIGSLKPGQKTILVVAGYLPWDHGRPIFGEHFIGATPSEFYAAFRLPAHRTPTMLPMIISSHLFPHVCNRDGVAELRNPSADERVALENASDVIFAVRSGDEWIIQRNSIVSTIPSDMPRCEMPQS